MEKGYDKLRVHGAGCATAKVDSLDPMPVHKLAVVIQFTVQQLEVGLWGNFMSAKNSGKITVMTPLKAVRNVKVKSQGGPQKNVHTFKLKNGLTVLFKESHKSPVVSIQMWVRTGSADEQKGEEGISHFIEHLVFKGTNEYGVGEIASCVEAAGGEINAYTTFDQTVFYITLSSSEVSTASSVISQMMGYPSFDAAEIDNEREVVIEEIKRGNDSPSRQMSQVLFSNTFTRHPYGIPVIGYDRVVRKVSRRKILEYFHGRYNPKNMFLVVAGDLTLAELRPILDGHFAGIPERKLRRAKRKKEPVQKTPRVAVRYATFDEAQLALSWRIPDGLHRDIPGLDVLALVLGQGESSRLYRGLRLEKSVVNSIYASCYSPRDAGLFAVSCSLNPQNMREALVEIQSHLIRMITQPASLEELTKAITNFRAEQFYSLETVDGLARRLGSAYLAAEDLKYSDKYLRAIEAVTTQDLVKLAKKYLRPDRVCFSVLLPEEHKKIWGKAQAQSWIKSFKKAWVQAGSPKGTLTKNFSRKVKPWKGAVPTGKEVTTSSPETLRLATGLTLVMRPNFDTPVVSLRLGMLGGLRAEEPRNLGVTELVSRVWTAGTKRLSEGQILHEIDKSASSLSSFGGRNSLGLSMESLKFMAEPMLELLGEVLLEPAWDERVVEREKAQIAEARRTRNDNPAQVCSQLFLEKLFQGHPYSWDMLGTENSLGVLRGQDLRAFVQRLSSPSGLVLSAAGAWDRKTLLTWAEYISGRLPQGRQFDRVFKAPEVATAVRDYRESQKQQSHIILGFRGLAFQDPDRFALQLIQSVLAGQGGRLFVELRDKASLAYSVAPLRMEGIETGYFGAYIGCSPEKGARAIEMMREELHRMCEETVPQVELLRAQRYLIGRHDIDLQRNSALANGMLFDTLYGLGTEELFHYRERVMGVTAEDLRRTANRLFLQPEVLTVVGPVCPW